MKSTNYMVPDHGFGNVNNIPIQEVNPDFLVDLMEKRAPINQKSRSI